MAEYSKPVKRSPARFAWTIRPRLKATVVLVRMVVCRGCGVTTCPLTTMAGSSVRYHNVAYLGARQIVPPGADEDPVARLTNIYQWIIRNAGARIAESLNILSEGGNLPAVFHCTAGKDRVGILAAMVLGVLGVDRDQIMQDYVLTNEIIDELGERLRARPGNEHRTLDSFRAQPKAMELGLDELADKYGGPAGYLQAHGVTNGTIDKLRDALLE